ncbi:MAG: hypothetical protein HYX47_14700 [Burkholderiales bacterium]|nr:hypothetical protein [Burkholderiales bacterium]
MFDNPSPELTTMELITGPICGFHLACYTVSVSEGVFAYAKVCKQRPESVWAADTSVSKVAAGPFEHEDAALAAVTEKTRAKLEEGLKQYTLSRLLRGLVLSGTHAPQGAWTASNPFAAEAQTQ